MNAVELAARFSIAPSALGHCGPRGASSVLKKFLAGEASEAAAIRVLEKFEGLFPYMRLIGRANSLKPFDARVVEAYWLGNELLERVAARDYKKMISRDFASPRLLPRSLAAQIVSMLPSDALPSHNFHVLFFHYANARTLAGRFQPTLATVNECVAAPALVKRAAADSSDSLDVTRLAVGFGFGKNKKLFLRRRPARVKPLFLKAKKGESVAVHWGNAVAVLSREQKKNSARYFERAVDSVNALL